MQPNLGRLFTHNFPLNMNEFKIFRYHNCSSFSCSICSICNIADKDYFLKLKFNFYLPICINSSCNSSGIIYIIKCKICPDVFYIGESGRSVSNRIREHINDIKRFTPFYISKNVSFHFNLFRHNYLHLSTCLFLSS